jgi:hypothetical protein
MTGAGERLIDGAEWDGWPSSIIVYRGPSRIDGEPLLGGLLLSSTSPPELWLLRTPRWGMGGHGSNCALRGAATGLRGLHCSLPCSSTQLAYWVGRYPAATPTSLADALPPLEVAEALANSHGSRCPGWNAGDPGNESMQ